MDIRRNRPEERLRPLPRRRRRPNSSKPPRSDRHTARRIDGWPTKDSGPSSDMWPGQGDRRHVARIGASQHDKDQLERTVSGQLSQELHDFRVPPRPTTRAPGPTVPSSSTRRVARQPTPSSEGAAAAVSICSTDRVSPRGIVAQPATVSAITTMNNARLILIMAYSSSIPTRYELPVGARHSQFALTFGGR